MTAPPLTPARVATIVELVRQVLADLAAAERLVADYRQELALLAGSLARADSTLAAELGPDPARLDPAALRRVAHAAVTRADAAAADLPQPPRDTRP